MHQGRSLGTVLYYATLNTAIKLTKVLFSIKEITDIKQELKCKLY